MRTPQVYSKKLNCGGRERGFQLVAPSFKRGQISSKQMLFVEQFVRLRCPSKEPLILEEMHVTNKHV